MSQSSFQSSPHDPAPPVDTVRPVSDPVIIALTSADPRASFLELMRSRLVPGVWEFPIDNGFAWIPYRLMHSVECFGIGDQTICRSTFVLVDNVDDDGQAVNMVGYLNQRSFGGVIWFDNKNRTICITSFARLDPATWWNAYLLAMIVPRLVGICEQLAPRLAEWVGGDVAATGHPEHGPRNDPDQFIAEHTTSTFTPEAGAGLWWSEHEVLAFRNVISDFVVSSGGEVFWPADTLPDTLLSGSQGVHAEFPFDDGRLNVRAGEVDHPDLGLGLQVLLSSSVQFAGSINDDGETEMRSWDAMFVANSLNAELAIRSNAALTIGGWALWDNQLHHVTYVLPEVLRMLQSAAVPTVGEVLGLLVTDIVENAGALPRILRDESFGDVEWNHIDEVTWRGVDQNAGRRGLLVDETDRVPRALEGVAVNELLPEPIELDDELWALQHSRLIATMGIFNPVGPSVGSIELSIDYNVGRGLLLERTRHPFLPSLRLWAILDRDGFDSLDNFVELMIERLPWGALEWVRVMDRDEKVADAVKHGLLRFANRTESDLSAAAQQLLDSAANPWIALASEYEPSGSIDDSSLDPAELWLQAVTHPAVVDSRLAYLRSAWEGSIALVNDPDGKAADEWVSRISDEVDQRRLGFFGGSRGQR